MVKKIKHRILKLIFSLVNKPLYILGFRRKVLFFDHLNWSEIQWNHLLSRTTALKLLYKVDAIKFEDIIDAQKKVPEISVNTENYRDLTFNGLILWEICKTGILASLETPVIYNCNDRALKIIKHYYTIAAQLILGSEVIVEKYKPDTIIVSQGATPMARPLVEIARKHNINLVATEGAFLANYFYCDNATGIILNRHSASRLLNDWIPCLEFTDKQRNEFWSLFNREKNNKRAEHIANSSNDNNVNIKGHLNISEEKKIALFIGQVLTDASIIMDSPYFQDPVILIERLYNYFKDKNDWCLVVKLHPKEHNGVSWANSTINGYGPPPGEHIGQLPYNDITYRRLVDLGLKDEEGEFYMLYDNSLNTDELAKNASLGIAVNSQAGFEMALQGKPVVVCGDAFYSRKGFTFDISDESALEPILDKALKSKVDKDEIIKKSEKYAWYLTNTVLLPKDIENSWKALINILDNKNSNYLRDRIIDRKFKESK